MVLCIMFGITASVCSLFLRFGRRLLVECLSHDARAAIRMPSDEDILLFQQSFAEKYSLLQDVFAVADGLKVYLEQAGDTVVQNMFYNGWKHDHYVGNVLVFAPDGTVIACSLNAPGAMHDSVIANWGKVYDKLEVAFDRTGARCVVDSAFSKGYFPFLIKSSQDMPTTSNFGDIIRARQATSARQASEWGMRAFQGSFPRLKDRLAYEERGERRIILQLVVLLFNMRTRLVGINQILSTYMPFLSVEANDILYPE